MPAHTATQTFFILSNSTAQRTIHYSLKQFQIWYALEFHIEKRDVYVLPSHWKMSFMLF